MDEEAALNDLSLAASSSSAPPPDPTSLHPAPPSKSALKRAAKAAQWEASKGDRRAAEKARRKARHAQRMEGLRAGTLDEREAESVREQQRLKREKQAARKRDLSGKEGDVRPWRGGVIVDCGFDELMSEAEIKSMASQLSYIYSTNRLSPRPFARVLFTSLNKRLGERLERVSQGGCRRWARIECREEGLEGLLPGASAGAGDKEAEEKAEAGAETEEQGNPFAGQTLVYLTADAEDEVTELREDETYIIGGIVDRNRYKNLCRDKAARLGIRTARLPIGTHLAALPTRKVLTVNQVYDILVRYNEGPGGATGWQEAFEKVVPQRKFVAEGKQARRKRGREGGGEGGVEGERDDDDGQDEDAASQEAAGDNTDEEMERLMNEEAEA